MTAGFPMTISLSGAGMNPLIPTSWEVLALLEEGGCKVLQPDVMHAGGITEM